ncbi:unnamed protein product, partial [Laminaria digitata]
IDVSKLRQLALDTDGEANDGGEPGSGQAEAPEACDVEFTEILGRYLRPVPGTSHYIYWNSEDEGRVADQQDPASFVPVASSAAVAAHSTAPMTTAIARPASRQSASPSYQGITSTATSTRMPLGQGTLVGPVSRVTPYDDASSSSASTSTSLGVGLGQTAMQVARHGGAQRAPGRARQGSSGCNASPGRDAPSPTNAALLGAASAHPPLFVRFECVHETLGSGADGGSVGRGDGGGVVGAGGRASAGGKSHSRVEAKGRVVDTHHSLSRALKADPQSDATPRGVQEAAEEDMASHVAGTS